MLGVLEVLILTTAIRYGGAIFGFVGKHQSFESDAGSYRKPVKGTQQWSDMSELRKIEDKPCC